MSEAMIEAARAEVRDKMGSALEAKASDSMILQLAAMSVGRAALPLEGAILRFRAEDLAARAKEAREEVEAMPEWRGMLGAAPELRGQMSSQKLVRPQIMESARRRFHRLTQGVRAELEKTGDAGEFALRSATAAGAEPLVRACWLNSTLKAPGTPEALAEIASDDNLVYMDLPRALELEIFETAAVVGAPAFRQAHQRSGSGVKVAVIDSEVFVGHSAFGGRAHQKGNFSGEPIGTPDDHGTAVAAIIGSGDEAFPGMAPEVTIFAYKVYPKGDGFQGSLAIQQALEDGADIANCSWGVGLTTDGSSPEVVACDNAWAMGLTIVKSAGNKGTRGVSSPADAEGIIVVGACNRAGDRVEDYSSRGPTDNGLHRPHLVAPGGDRDGDARHITSALVPVGFGETRNPGTSFAAPHVAGLLALLLEDDPELDPDGLRQRLLERCRPLDGAFAIDDQGSGLAQI